MDYKALGKEAFEKYFQKADKTQDEGLLEEIITDIAIREELNPHEIARVAQHANTRIFLKLFRTSEDKTVEFSVADPHKVLVRLKNKESGVMTEGESPEISGELFKVPEESPEPLSEVVDYREIERLENKLKNRLDDVAVRTMEQRPQLVRRLVSRIHEHGPQTVIIAVRQTGGPEDLLKAACADAKVDYESVQVSESDYLVDDSDELLQKLASYGKMLAERQTLEEDLVKVSRAKGLIAGVKKWPGRLFRASYTIGEARRAAQATKSVKRSILDDAPLPSPFTVSNAPRVAPRGAQTYIKYK